MANALQAVLNRAIQQAPKAEEKAAVTPPRRGRGSRSPVAAPEAEAPTPVVEKVRRPGRTGTRLIGGHFPPEVARQLRMLAAEDDTTVQALLEEAIDLLFVKKGKAAIAARLSDEHQAR
ncbi:ribbon-helix-helix domain-containing protein [Xanthobacter sp. TB0136]|uniref:ribbon-helix-helix domain-containing protein n=1 Tax=Xanthobacter sp. TB0136 TaxID=3459177 RepID=UPI004039EB63